MNAITRRRDQRFTGMAVSGRRAEAERFLRYGLWMLQAGLDTGVDKAFLADTARGLHDAIGNMVGTMATDLDNAHLETSAAEIDRAELDALIEEIES